MTRTHSIWLTPIHEVDPGTPAAAFAVNLWGRLCRWWGDINDPEQVAAFLNAAGDPQHASKESFVAAYLATFGAQRSGNSQIGITLTGGDVVATLCRRDFSARLTFGLAPILVEVPEGPQAGMRVCGPDDRPMVNLHLSGTRDALVSLSTTTVSGLRDLLTLGVCRSPGMIDPVTLAFAIDAGIKSCIEEGRRQAYDSSSK